MIELSLFDGISAGQVAMNRIGVTPTKYYAAEVDKFAIKCTQANFPNTIQLGDVTKWREWDIDWSEIDLVTGGFPCQAWSMAGKQLGDKDERGMLFWVMLDIMKHVRYHNPNADFLIENVKMKKEFEEYITYHTENALGEVHKVLINSALVSAQNRQRYYWTSKPVGQPEDKGLILADVLESGFADRDKALTVTTRIGGATEKRYKEKSMHQMAIELRPCEQKVLCGRIVGRKINPETGKRDDYNPDLKAVQRFEPRLDERSGTLTTVQKDNILCFASCSGRDPRVVTESKTGKANTLTANYFKGLDADSRPGVIERCDVGKTYHEAKELSYRKLTPMECERLQTFHDGYTAMLSNTQRYKTLGNSWTVDVICHIFKEMSIK
ncbi:C-5 cytosine-specific DNA methylase [Vibrio phage 1.242.O._10N.261.54.B2]|nr:C-5 cytosine-specific DNA methylase [Vibrio phage 1.242.O._10N.261.54.B2]